MVKPRLLDLFCGAGGCARGYQEAGFYVVGVDIEPQPHYCGDEFYQADALSFPLAGFDMVHASPVCKGYTQFNLSPKEKHEKLIGQVKARLIASGLPYVIENVAGAKADLPAALWLCGTMFGLRVWRHRLFESSMLLFAPCPCNHTIPPISIHGHISEDHAHITKLVKGQRRYRTATPQESHDAMGIDWMNRDELAEAVPPAFTQWIGQQFREVL